MFVVTIILGNIFNLIFLNSFRNPNPLPFPFVNSRSNIIPSGILFFTQFNASTSEFVIAINFISLFALSIFLNISQVLTSSSTNNNFILFSIKINTSCFFIYYHIFSFFSTNMYCFLSFYNLFIILELI